MFIGLILSILIIVVYSVYVEHKFVTKETIKNMEIRIINLENKLNL